MDYKDNKLNYLNGNELLKILLLAWDNLIKTKNMHIVIRFIMKVSISF